MPEYDFHGRIAGVLAAVATSQNGSGPEEELKVSEERLRLTLEAAQIGIWDRDVVNDRHYVSPIYHTMLRDMNPKRAWPTEVSGCNGCILTIKRQFWNKLIKCY